LITSFAFRSSFLIAVRSGRGPPLYFCCFPGNGVDAVVLPVLPPAVRLLWDHLPHPPPRLAGLQQARQRTRQGQIIRQISRVLPFNIFQIFYLHIKEADFLVYKL
jgi:hypothetical protein